MTCIPTHRSVRPTGLPLVFLPSAYGLLLACRGRVMPLGLFVFTHKVDAAKGRRKQRTLSL